MLGWLYRALVGSFSSCNHKWKVIRTIQVARASDDDELLGYQYTQECEHCGKLKKTTISSLG